MSKEFRIEVYNHAGVDDAPVRVCVEISPKRADEIRRLAALVREYQELFDVHTITACDYSTDWFNPAWDADGNEIEGEGGEQRMDCCEIVVTHNEFYYQALIKDCDIFCFSDRISLTELPESDAHQTKWPYGG